MVDPVESPLVQVMQCLKRAVDTLATLDSRNDEIRRDTARAELAKGLSLILAAERAGKASAELRAARSLLQRLLQFVEERVDMAHLLRAQQQTRKRSQQLHLCRTGDLPVEAEVWTSGVPERQVDWWSISPLSKTLLFGAMGTVIGGESDAAMIGSALCGALAVARKGIGTNLVPDRAHLVLHTTLKDLFGSGLTVPTLTWRLDCTTNTLTLASAGHRSLWHVRDGVFQTLRARPGSPIGVEPTQRARALSLPLRKGDRLIGLTAGVFEVANPDGAFLRESDLRVAVLSALTRDPRRTGVSVVREAVERHAQQTRWPAQATAFSLQLR